ncbi:MAG: DUF4349 domain-containing protein [Planctomycetia bacterium]|nr:DUF4349 domain-containing protein [Planctomycetia bacterium]
MADHAWTQESLATYCAGGLEPAERLELEEHVAGCLDCSQALDDARRLDEQLTSLFADARPRPGLEDRMITRLRNVKPNSGLHFYAKLALSAAAVLFLGMFGALMGAIIDPSAPAQARGPSRFLAVFADRSESASMRETTTAGVPMADELGDRVEEVDAYTRRLANEALAGGLPQEEGERARRAEGRNMVNDSIGNDPDVATNYNVDRLKEASVPGPVTTREQAGVLAISPQPPGFGSRGQGAMDGRSGSTRHDGDKRSGGFYSYRDQSAAGKPSAGEGKEAADLEKVKKLEESYFKPLAQAVPTNAPATDSKGGQNSGPGNPPKPGEPAPTPRPEPKTEPAAEEPAPVVTQRKIIRSGDIEFEVDVFDDAVAKVTKIATEEKGFIGTVNSEKLPNGKVRGVIVVRMPPERLDTLILKLRALGELKSQRIGTQDVTKQYTDMESELRAARAMENRLIEIIKSGKGEIKDLLAAEKELGVWRTKIEKCEGELRYYNNLISLSTLNITLAERDVRSPFALTETEHVQMGVEVEDVEKAQQEAHQAIADAKGRVTKSELKQHAAGQFQCVILFETSPEAAGPLRDRLKQLGVVVRMEAGRTQQSEGPAGRPLDVKVTRNDVQFNVSLFNVVNIAPRETTQLHLACVDAEAIYKNILHRVAKANGRVVTHRLDRQRNEQTTGQIVFEVKTPEADAILTDLKSYGEVMKLNVNENPDTNNVTNSKRGFQIQLWALGTVQPRETVHIQLVAADVPTAYRKLQEAIAKSEGRVLNAELNEADKRNIWAQLHFDVRRTKEGTIDAAFKDCGEIFARNATRSNDRENTIESKVALDVRVINVANLAPRVTHKLVIEVQDVEKTAALLAALTGETKGRLQANQITREKSGRVVSKQVLDVPLASAATILDRVKGVGTIRAMEALPNLQAPDGNLAVARLDVALSNQAPIVAQDEGVGDSFRKALSMSLNALLWSASAVTTGIIFLGPWVLMAWLAWKVAQRMRKKEAEAASPTTAAPTA